MNPSRTIKVESLVTTDKTRPSIVSHATFQAVESGGQIGLVLDLEPTKPDTHMVLFHPAQKALTKIGESRSEIVYQHIGTPIDVSDYLHLPSHRRGFVVRD